MANLNVKKGDTVQIIVGKKSESKKDAEYGRRGKVLVVDTENHRVIVEESNMVKRHKKPRSAKDKGGIIDKPRAIDVSNVMLVCPSCGKPTRVGHKLGADGKKYLRVCKRKDCGASLDVKKEKEVKKTARKRASKQVKDEINKEE